MSLQLQITLYESICFSIYSSLYCIGQWRCDIEQESHLPEFGAIALLNNEIGFVRDVRLPRHTVPENYDITLIPFIIEVNYMFLFRLGAARDLHIY